MALDLKTGIIYDERMCLHDNIVEEHPEQPDRIKAIYKMIEAKGLLEYCEIMPSREATLMELLTVHDEKHVLSMYDLKKMDTKDLLCEEKKYNSIYFNKHSYQSALLSAGGVIELCEQVILRKIKNGIAIVRPPGHHAEKDCAMGFCLFNNVAVAAASIQKKYGKMRILILDWDVHHGNATQHMFESDPSVLYISIHRYDNGYFYPGSTDGSPAKVGTNEAKGKNINIAWNTTKTSQTIGDTEYIYAYETLIKPIVNEYDPELIIISAGFDCAKGDPLGGINVSPAGFNFMTRDLMNYANGKIIVALEGGYNLTSISCCMTACLEALLQMEPLDVALNDYISNVAIEAVKETNKYQQPFWKCLKTSINK